MYGSLSHNQQNALEHFILKNIYLVWVSENHVMAGVFDDLLANGASMMEFILVSSVQIENGPRKLWPHFGFFYKAVATKISAYGYAESTGAKIKIVDLGVVNPIGNSITKDAGWRYISKNLSTIPDFVQMGKANSEKAWRVNMFFFDRRGYLNMALSLNNVLIMSCLFVFRSSYNSKFNKVEKYSLIILVREFIH